MWLLTVPLWAVCILASLLVLLAGLADEYLEQA